MWFEESVFYQLYPLTLCGAPAVNAPVSGGAPANDGHGTGHFPAGTFGHTSAGAAGAARDGISRLAVFAPHLQKLGIGGVYLNPIFESDSHGYDTRDYRVLDRRLGTNAEFRKIVDLYHSCGIRVVLDGVFNHVGRGFFAFRDVQKKKQASPYKDWFRIDFGGDTHFHDGFWYEAWEGHYELVKLNLENPAVQQYLMESIDLWFREFDIDGIRLDVAYLLPLWFIAMVKDRIRAHKPDAFLLGEILGDNAGRFYDQGHVDAITDYPGYKGLWSSFNSFNLFELAHTIKRNYGEMYRGRQLFSFADNHDVERIATKLADPEKLPLIYGLLLTLPGIPCIYYGSEWGTEGRKEKGSDASLRPAFDAPRKTDLTEKIAEMIRFRNHAPELQTGAFRELRLQNRFFAFAREKDGNRTVCAVNIDDAPAVIDIPDYGKVTVPARTMSVSRNGAEFTVFAE